uniref:PHTF1/2 N-terminal domain-containing protein n=1 Tax=Electrophorus electricus TaxID=8005 RepID=A0AAY5EVT0_ELEEL
MSRIAWYQEKIGAYDQQIWEKSLEQAELKGIRNKPKKTGHIKPDLIDVDLVRGSTFSKAKPESPWTALTRKGLVRVLLYPFFFKWWIQVTSKCIATSILVLYFLQVAAVVLYVEVPAATASEVLGPMCLMLLLGTVHCQIVSTESCRSFDRLITLPWSCRHRKSRGVKRADHRDGGGVELKAWHLKQNQRFYRSQKNRRQVGINTGDGLGWDMIWGGTGHLFLFLGSLIKYGSCLCLDVWFIGSNYMLLGCFLCGRQQEEDHAMTTVTTATPSQVEQSQPSESSRPASDSEDMLWEEFLQGPDSASSASSYSEEEGLHHHNHTVPPPAVLTTWSWEDHQLSWLQVCHPSEDRVSAIIWEQGECKKADMSVLEISGIILTRVKLVEQGLGYLVLGGLITATLTLLPFCFRLTQQLDAMRLTSVTLRELVVMAAGMPSLFSCMFFFITAVERVFLTSLFFFMMCVAERTYKQRLLFAKLFSHITSARKAKKSEIPHFRLKKVQNIKMWLSLRSFLKRRGPQRSVDVIVSSIFLLALSIAFTICAQLLHSHHTFLDWESNWELLVWGVALLGFLLRLATLGTETNHKYSNASVLLTEQINLYLKMEKKPAKKDELSIVNNVLKLATKLLKELDTPFRLLGLTVNPLIYNITRVVILSAISAVVSDLLGFNIRLWKIKP